MPQQAQHPIREEEGAQAGWVYQERAGSDEAKPVGSEAGWSMADWISGFPHLHCSGKTRQKMRKLFQISSWLNLQVHKSRCWRGLPFCEIPKASFPCPLSLQGYRNVPLLPTPFHPPRVACWRLPLSISLCPVLHRVSPEPMMVAVGPPSLPPSLHLLGA